MDLHHLEQFALVSLRDGSNTLLHHLEQFALIDTIRDPGPGPAVEFVRAADQVQIASGTSLEAFLPDLQGVVLSESVILMTVLHRSVLTPPAGWTLVHERSESSWNQVVAVYRKDTISPGDSEAVTVWQQSASDRMYLQAILFSTTESGYKVQVQSPASAQSASGASQPFPDIISTGPGQCAFMCAGYTQASTLGPQTVSVTGQLISPEIQDDNRLVAGFQYLLYPETWAGNFTGAAGASAAISMLLVPEPTGPGPTPTKGNTVVVFF